MTPSLSDVARLVDLERYPIHALDGERCMRLVEDWKSELDRTGACNLHGFLTASGARELAAEAEVMMPMAYERTFTANFRYQDKADPEIPASGPASRFWTRPPHIHFKAHARGYADLTTQMYFAGEPLNESDRLFRSHSRAEQEQCVVSFHTVQNAQVGLFNLTLKKI